MKAVMYICGVVFILAGIGGAIGYAQMPPPVGYIVAPLWAVIWIGSSFIWFNLGNKLGNMLKPEDIQNPVMGTASIVTFRQGSMRITVGGMTSYQLTLTLDVVVPGQAPYRVEGFQTMFPMMRIGQLRPGSQIAVRIDRNDAKRMAFDFDAPVGAMQAGMAPQIGPAMPGANPYAPQMAMAGGSPYMAQPQPLANAAQVGAAFQQLSQQGALAQAIAHVPHASAAELLARGTPGRASIVTATPTGQTLPDGRFVFAFTMNVWMQGSQQPIQAAVLHAVPPQQMARAVPGASLPVAVDPSNPTRSVAIDWNRA